MWQVRGLAHTERIPMCGTEKERDRERERDKERDGTGQSGSGSSTTFSPASGLGMFPTPPAQVTTSPQYNGPLRLPQLPHMPHISFTDRQCSSPLPRRKQVSTCLIILPQKYLRHLVTNWEDLSLTKLLILGLSQSLQLLWKISPLSEGYSLVLVYLCGVESQMFCVMMNSQLYVQVLNRFIILKLKWLVVIMRTVYFREDCSSAHTSLWEKHVI